LLREFIEFASHQRRRVVFHSRPPAGQPARRRSGDRLIR
jgi:hypothetical protein